MLTKTNLIEITADPFTGLPINPFGNNFSVTDEKGANRLWSARSLIRFHKRKSGTTISIHQIIARVHLSHVTIHCPLSRSRIVEIRELTDTEKHLALIFFEGDLSNFYIFS